MTAAKPAKKPKEERGHLSFRSSRKEINTDKFKGVGWLILEIALVIGLAFGVVKVFGTQVKSDNVSMSETIESGDIVLIDKASYRFREPAAGDIIAFMPVSKIKTNYSIKRIIAVPGDTVLISNGKLYINGELQRDNLSKTLMKEAGRAGVELTIPEGQYFVLGDNRNISEDSRYDAIGNVESKYILGRVYYDLTALKKVD